MAGEGSRMIEGAYAGLRVLDLGQGVAAPYCAMLLTMHGAEAMKLEPAAIGRAASATTPRRRRNSTSARKAWRLTCTRRPAAPPRRPSVPISSSRDFAPASQLGSDFAVRRQRCSTRASSSSRSAASVRKGRGQAEAGRVFRPARRPASGCVANVSAKCVWVLDPWQFRPPHRR